MIITMTRDEFIMKFPEKASLTGDALWNAMEDYLMTLPQCEPTITDWMGNKLKDGQIVDIYRTRNFIRGDIEFYRNGKLTHITRIPDEFIWEKLSEHKIINGMAVFCIGGFQCVSPLNILTFNQPCDIICIRGVSDNKEMYINFMGGIYSEPI